MSIWAWIEVGTEADPTSLKLGRGFFSEIKIWELDFKRSLLPEGKARFIPLSIIMFRNTEARHKWL
jgi:hypothetical protein